ncbi:integral membrane protein [Rutstroemia sp. NJR-2017a WRK4]|nr:integral membrane protein [Rutstroemia sp. NJR-2017a WRK4]
MSPNPTTVIVVSAVLVSLATISVGLRFYVRKVRQTKLGLDDWSILVALAMSFTLTVPALFIDNIASALGALGGHTPRNPKTGLAIDNPATVNSGKVEYASYVIMSLTFGTIKISVVSFYRRIFVGEAFRRWSTFLLIFIGLWMLAFFISLTLWCGTHPAAGWTSYKEILKYCDNLADLELAFAVTDAMTDLAVILTPIPILWKLQLSTNRKIALTGIFLLGFLYVEWASGADLSLNLFLDLLRRQLSEWLSSLSISTILDTTLGYRDFLGLVTNVEIWSEVEVCIAVIAACLPTLRPLFSGSSPESIIGSIRSVISLSSLNRSRSAVPKQAGYTQTDEEDGIRL